MRQGGKQRLLYLASKNLHKLSELKQILAGTDFDVKLCTDLDKEIAWDETGTTFVENATIKAQEVRKLSSKACILADDSGLEVNALKQAPGVYSSRYAGKDGDDKANNAKLLKELTAVPREQRDARFVCCLVFLDESGRKHVFQGYCKGLILENPQGSGSFGYDPLFFVPSKAKSLAEMSEPEKNAISHRGQAMRQFLEFISLD